MSDNRPSSEEAPALPPGWYDDPQLDGIRRWWDGSRWTHHIEQIEPEAPAATATSGSLAGFGVRLLAYVVDAGVLVGLLLALSPALTPLLDVEAATGDSPTAGLTLEFVLAAAVVVLAYWVAFESGPHGQTIGKWAVGIQVRSGADEGPISVPVALGRALVKQFVSGLFFWLGFLWMLFDRRNRTWHDLAVDTRVVLVAGDRPPFRSLLASVFRRR